MTKFATIDQAAHSGANGHNQRPEATHAQRIAGNYAKGRLTLHGLRIAIETPRGTLRHWQDGDGKSGSNLMKFHYGYLEGTLGNDGDELDCSLGPAPESERAYVINQFMKGRFDEHKIMLGFPDKRTAQAGYLSNYDIGWPGMDSCVSCSITQLKWWIANGNMKRKLTQDQLPYEGTDDMEKVLWDGANEPLRTTIDQVLYALRGHDGSDGLLFDSLSMAEILADSDGVLTFDALVIPFARIESRMAILRKVLDRAGDAVKVAAVQVSDPFTQRGSTNVAVIYELTDGQTVSIFFHNPDVTPKKIVAGDDLISWKWMLNKRDITVAVAPERGRDLDVRTVAARIMRIANLNSARFVAANGKRAEKLQVIADLKTDLATKEGELNGLLKQIEVATIVKERAYGDAVLATSATQDAYLRAGDNGGVDPKTGKTKDELRAEIDGQAAEIGALQNAINGKEAFVPEPVPEPVAVAAPNVDSIKAVITSEQQMPGTPDNWIVMNAARPLLGTETLSNGEFLSGRFYAAIDPQDYMAQAYIDSNVKMDASVVFVADKATQAAMALQTIRPQYQAAYMEMDEDERAASISGFVNKLNGKTYGELKELAAKGMPEVHALTWRDKYTIAEANERFRVAGINTGNSISPAYPTKGEAEAAAEAYMGGSDFPAPSDADKAAEPEKEIYRDYLIYPTKMKVGEEVVVRFAVQSVENRAREAAGERSIGGDTLHSTVEDARKEIDWQIKRDAANAKSQEEADRIAAEQQAQRDAARAEFEDVDGFADGMSPMQKEKVLQALNGVVKYSGLIVTRKALIRQKVAAGFYVENDDEIGTILTDGDVMQSTKQLTKTGLDYAAYLIAKRAPIIEPVASVAPQDAPLVEPEMEPLKLGEEMREIPLDADNKAIHEPATDPVAAVAAQQDAEMKDEDVSFLRSIIDGTHDLSDPGVPGDLGLMHKERSADAEFMALFKLAVKAYSSYAVAKAQAALAK